MSFLLLTCYMSKMYYCEFFVMEVLSSLVSKVLDVCTSSCVCYCHRILIGCDQQVVDSKSDGQRVHFPEFHRYSDVNKQVHKSLEMGIKCNSSKVYMIPLRLCQLPAHTWHCSLLREGYICI